jgi:hypothetical protein
VQRHLENFPRLHDRGKLRPATPEVGHVIEGSEGGATEPQDQQSQGRQHAADKSRSTVSTVQWQQLAWFLSLWRGGHPSHRQIMASHHALWMHCR